MHHKKDNFQFSSPYAIKKNTITSYPCLKWCIHCSTRHIYLANHQFHVLQIARADKKDLYIFSYVIMYWNLCMGEYNNNNNIAFFPKQVGVG